MIRLTTDRKKRKNSTHGFSYDILVDKRLARYVALGTKSSKE